jgi:hypothetical protein
MEDVPHEARERAETGECYHGKTDRGERDPPIAPWLRTASSVFLDLETPGLFRCEQRDENEQQTQQGGGARYAVEDCQLRQDRELLSNFAWTRETKCIKRIDGRAIEGC